MLYRLSLRDAAKRIRDGELTASELVRACLTRCSRLEARVQAWEHLDAGRALERAEELDAARTAGRLAGPLHGISLGIKDIIDVAGMPTTMGSPVYAGRVARETAAGKSQRSLHTFFDVNGTDAELLLSMTKPGI